MSLSRETHSTAHEQRVGHWYLREICTVTDGPSMGLCKYTEASWVCAGTSLAHRAGITQVSPEQETPEVSLSRNPNLRLWVTLATKLGVSFIVLCPQFFAF